MKHSITIVSAILHSIFFFCCFKLSKPQVYNVVPADAYTWSPIYPQSCECVEGDVEKVSCDLFKCTCTCDLTAQVCDYNCCCDPDCTSAQITRFQELGVCEATGESPDSTQMCYSSTELYGVNPRDPMGGQSTSQAAVGSALCVVKTNNNFKGDFYTENIGIQSADVFDSTKGQKPYNYIPVEPPVEITDSVYDQNDTIPAFLLDTDNTLITNGPGLLQIPVADFTGKCNDANFASFQNEQHLSSCSRTLSTNLDEFGTQCGTVFNVDSFIKKLRIAKSPLTQVIQGVTVPVSDVVDINVLNVKYSDSITGETRDVTSDWIANNCGTNLIVGSNSSSVLSASCSFASTEAASFVSPNYCQGAVLSTTYNITHDSSAITSVSASLIISDLPFTVPASSPPLATQSFGVFYMSYNPTGISIDNGNLVRRARSGNPGYLIGSPVLYANSYPGNDLIVEELIDGMQIPSPISPFTSSSPSATTASKMFGSSSCPRGNNDGFTTVLFGYDISSGCTLELNREEFKNFCCSGSSQCSAGSYSSPYVSPSGKPYFLDFPVGYVGAYGSASPADITQWFLLNSNLPGNGDGVNVGQWDEVSSTCYNMWSSLNIELLVAPTGEKVNPQDKITAARASLSTTDQMFPVPQTSSSTNVTFSFSLKVTVTFIRDVEISTETYDPPAPPVLFRVPNNVFYPFNINSGEMNSSPSVFVVMIVTILSSTLLMLN